MRTITVEELQRDLSANPQLTVVDVRTPAEYDQLHLEGSVNVPLDRLDPTRFLNKSNIHPPQKIYVICASGGRSQNAAKLFENKGFLSVVNIEGGLNAWTRAGFKVKTGASKVIGLERQVRIAAGSLVLLGVLLGKFVHPGFIWLSAIVGAGLINAGITDWCGMGLLLAKAPWNQRK